MSQTLCKTTDLARRKVDNNTFSTKSAIQYLFQFKYKNTKMSNAIYYGLYLLIPSSTTRFNTKEKLTDFIEPRSNLA